MQKPWVYALIYGLLGYIVVRLNARKLINIEREPLDSIRVSSQALSIGKPSEERRITWSELQTVVSANYRNPLGPPIQLLSQLVLSTTAESIVISAVTAGYDHLLEKLREHLNKAKVKIEDRDISILRVLLITGIVTLGLYLLILINNVPIEVTVTDCIVDSPTYGHTLTVPLARVTVPFVFLYGLSLPGVTLWQELIHRLRLRRVHSSERMEMIISLRSIFILSILWLLLVFLVLIFVSSAMMSPETVNDLGCV